MSKTYNQRCNIASTLDIIGDRWTLLIVRELFQGFSKFNDLKQALQGISPNILSERLQFLENEGIILSRLYSKHPPRFSYALTDKGKELRHVLNALAIWGQQHLDHPYSKVVHSKCEQEVGVTYYCPHCEMTSDDLRYVQVERSD